MEFEQFAPARDFCYLAALLFGAGLGCILNRFRRAGSARFRNWTVTAAYCFFSGALAALTAAIIYSGGGIFTETSLYLPLFVITAVLALAVRFPRAAGFPLILVSGIFIVWMGYACLRFPVINDFAQGRLLRDRSGLIHIRLQSHPEKDPDTSLSYHPAGEDAVLEFKAFSFSPAKVFPLAGGLNRGLIVEIRSGNERLYRDPRLGANDRLAGVWQRFFSFQESLGSLETKTLLPGTSLVILFDGSALAFR